MSLQLVNVGSAPDSSTGDPIRTAFTKTNDLITELYLYGPVRHRQSLLEYRRVPGTKLPGFLSTIGLEVSLLAPLVGSIMAGVDSMRGERNLMVVLSADQASAWTLTPSKVSYLYVDINPVDGTLTYGKVESPNEYVDSYISPASPSSGDHWVDRAGYRVVYWDGSAWQPAFRLFLARLITDASAVTALSYITDNEETLIARQEARKAALIFG